MLTGHFLQHFRERRRSRRCISPAKPLTALAAHDFPGNVRELENALRRAVALSSGGLITIDCLPPEIAAVACKAAAAAERSNIGLIADRPNMEELQRRYLQLILEETGGTAAAPLPSLILTAGPSSGSSPATNYKGRWTPRARASWKRRRTLRKGPRISRDER